MTHIGWLFAPRPIGLLLAVSFALGAGYALTMLPGATVLGTGPFWDFPRGTMPGADNDMAQVLAGHLFLQHTPWSVPLLYTPDLGAPAGTNIFWLDAVPWVSLAGKLLATATGSAVNLLGWYLFLCFASPGVGMTLLLWAAGQRHLLATCAGTLLANATPFLLYRWGHMATQAQSLIVLALALYIAHRRAPLSLGLAIAWAGLLTLTCLTSPYLFAMVVPCWIATLAQRRIDATVPTGRLLAELLTIMALLIAVMLITGILNPALQAGGSPDFGVFSMNLASPVTPQLSGLLPSTRPDELGAPTQYEGYAWLGSGVLLLLVCAAAASWRSAPDIARSHVALLCVLTGCLLFALSNRIYVGHHLLLDVPLPRVALHALGAFRSSGRFFWPVGYALVGAALITVLRCYRPSAAIAILLVVSAAQLIDVAPLHRAIAQTARTPRNATLDRAAIASLMAQARAVMVFPSHSCVQEALAPQMLGTDLEDDLMRANMELQLAAAHLDRPINSVYVARLLVDCQKEQRSRDAPLRPGVAYVYLLPFQPGSAQLGGHAPGHVCGTIGWARACLIPVR